MDELEQVFYVYVYNGKTTKEGLKNALNQIYLLDNIRFDVTKPYKVYKLPKGFDKNDI